MTLARAVSLGLAFVLALAGCKPGGATRSDAGVDARAPVDAGGALDAGGASASADAAAADDLALPAATSDELTLRAQHLFEAILRDNPDLASDILFPRDAFESAHDATDPGKVWDNKLAASFRRGVHSLHKRTKGIERAQFVSFEIGSTVTQATVRHHEWKVPLWRVPHARLTFTLDGRTSRFDIGELTAWRGAWYVTKLR
ncbi:MAG: hypothetical protein ACLQVI_38300 [Polyangiaceae bacterium]